MEIILASQSPRRRELWGRMGIRNCRVGTPGSGEHRGRELPPEERELREALDIVNMFDLAEITQISEAIMALSGAMNGKVTIVEQLKK